MRIVQYVPGQFLRLERSIPPSNLRAAIVGLVFALPIVLPLMAVVGVAMDPRETFHLKTTVAVALTLGILDAGVLTLAWFALRDHDFVESLTVDGAGGVVRIACRFLCFRREARLPLSELDGIEIHSSPRSCGFLEGPASRLLWKLHGSRASWSRSTLLAAPPQVEDDARLSLLLSIAAIARLKAYRVEENDALGYRAVASREIEGNMSRLDGPATPEDVDIARFRSPYRIVGWAPGREVRFERRLNPQELGGEGCAALCLSLIPLVFFVMAAEHQGWARAILLCLGAGCTGALVWLFVTSLVRDLLPRRCVMDWGERVIRVEGFGGGVTDFADIESIRLENESQVCRRHRRGAPTETFHLYRSKVLAVPRSASGRPRRPILIVETGWDRGGLDHSRKEIARIARRLADSMGLHPP